MLPAVYIYIHYIRYQLYFCTFQSHVFVCMSVCSSSLCASGCAVICVVKQHGVILAWLSGVCPCRGWSTVTGENVSEMGDGAPRSAEMFGCVGFRHAAGIARRGCVARRGAAGMVAR